MTNLNHANELIYLFDPLCGWCYGASPKITELAKTHKINLMPTGLFADTGKKMDKDFAKFAWENDQKIQRLTGVTFSEAYRKNVLNTQGDFDSRNLINALTAVQQTAPEQELVILSALQKMRYVEGKDSTDLSVINSLLLDNDLSKAIELLESTDITPLVNQRIAEGQRLAKQYQLRGVPNVLIQQQGQQQEQSSKHWQVVDSQLLYV